MTHDKELIAVNRAIRKAFDNGWSYHQELPIEKVLTLIYKERVYLTADFAKAIWGEDQYLGNEVVKEGWREHLQQMVIADDPIAYLGDNI